MVHVYVSFGPVQSFISQARTTHDLWTGSYLLSILGREAIRSVLTQHPDTEVIRPRLEKDSLDDLVASRKVDRIDERVGTVPNLLEFDADDNPSSVAKAAVEGWNRMWEDVCKEALGRVKSATPSSSHDEFLPIWTRQVSSHWDSYWTIGEYTGLTRRKAIRNFSEEPEQGRKCTICGNREILRGESNRFQDIREFWHGIAKNLEGAKIQDEGSERLCSICLIKRMCPDILAEIVGSDDKPFPSTVSFSMLPWRLALTQSDDAMLGKAIDEYLSALKDAGVPTLEGIWKNAKENHDILNFEGEYFIPERISEGKMDLTQKQIDSLLPALDNLRKRAKAIDIPDYNPYYAVLSMDGDSIGETLSNNPGSKRKLSKKMSEFANQVVTIVESCWGRLVYAGGDDVLAFLPTHTVLQTAYRIREVFLKTMSETDIDNPPTISAGIVFAHQSAPMSSVVSRSHALLEDVAKEHVVPGEAVENEAYTKKDAFALETWNRGGTNLHVLKKWESSVHGKTRAWVDVLTDASERFYKNDKLPITSSFIHSAAQSLRKMSWSKDEADTVEELFLVNYLRSRHEKISKLKGTPEGRKKAADLVGKLVDLSVCWDGSSCTYNPDHLLFTQFLSRGGAD